MNSAIRQFHAMNSKNSGGGTVFPLDTIIFSGGVTNGYATPFNNGLIRTNYTGILGETVDLLNGHTATQLIYKYSDPLAANSYDVIIGFRFIITYQPGIVNLNLNIVSQLRMWETGGGGLGAYSLNENLTMINPPGNSQTIEHEFLPFTAQKNVEYRFGNVSTSTAPFIEVKNNGDTINNPDYTFEHIIYFKQV